MEGLQKRARQNGAVQYNRLVRVANRTACVLITIVRTRKEGHAAPGKKTKEPYLSALSAK